MAKQSSSHFSSQEADKKGIQEEPRARYNLPRNMTPVTYFL
jgi:hypothetical protein